MIANNNAIVVNYPNSRGDFGRYDLCDQREYFTKFEGGVTRIFELALQNTVDGDLLEFSSECNKIFDAKQNYENQCFEVFDNYYLQQPFDGGVSAQLYSDDRREFQRRIFDIYRYAKTSLACLGDNCGFSMVQRLKANPKFETCSFLLK